MKVIHGIHNFKSKSTPVALTLGFFDGVHRGHKLLIDKLIETAKKINGISVVLTFDSHPLRVIAPDKLPPKIMTLTQRLEYLEKLGVDYIIVQPFDDKFAEITADDFLNEIIKKRINAKAIVGGYDCQFGKNRKGNLNYLKKFADANNYIFLEVPPLTIDHKIVSSTEVRSSIKKGDFLLTEHLLGRPWTIRALVVKGHRLGRIIGFPTANLAVDFLTLPIEGVYAAFARIDDIRYNAIMYVGTRPTFDESSTDLVCEVYIMGFSNDLYGKWLTVQPVQRLREDIKFDSMEELKKQIFIDVDKSYDILNNL